MNRMTGTRKVTWHRRVVALAAAVQIVFCQATPLLALPQNERVASGEVSFSRHGDTMTVLQTSRKAIVNYDGFDIGAPETVQFIQPDSSAAILNRVTGDQVSVIAGVLLANGNVYLINPNGILFTSSATISVASLFASALDISDSDFSAGRLLFSGSSGSVVNRGEITAVDRACLFGSMVENSGTIRAGNVLMSAASRSVEIDNVAGGSVRLIVDDQAVGRDTTTQASDQINPIDDKEASPTRHTAVRDDIQPSTDSFTPSETVRIPANAEAAIAQGAATAGMVINGGTVSVSGLSGGNVMMSGNQVGQFGVVHADGSAGDGGRVTLIAADTVALGETSLTTANAGANGNGGTVTVFSPDTTLFRKDARIEAKGGSVAGDGGFIEVSGLGHVEIFGSADASAPQGNAGTFLIDPSNVTLANVPGTGSWSPSGGPPYTQFNPDSDTAIANIAILLQSLKLNNVTITTMNGSGTQAGNITVADSIDLDGTGGHQLRLEADNNIVINSGANIEDLTPGTPDATSISLRSRNDISIYADIDTGGGDVSINARNNVVLTSSIVTDGGSVFSGGHDFTSSAGATIATSGGDVRLMHSGMVSINDTINSGGGLVRIDADDLSLQANLSAGSVQINESHGGGIGLGATPVPGGLNIDGSELHRITTPTLKLNTAGSIVVDHITGPQSQNAHSVTLASGGAVTFDTNPSDFDTLTVIANNGITVNQNLTTLSGDLSLNGDANNTPNGSDGIQFADGVLVTAAGGLTLETVTGDITAAGALGLVANKGVTIKDNLLGPLTGGTLVISADNDADGSGTVSIAAGATINEFAGAILIDADDLDLQGSLSAASILISESHGGGIGLGVTASGLTIAGNMLQHIATTDLTLTTSGSIIVDGIATADSDPVNNVTLVAGGSVGFENHPSTFDTLTVRADNGITVNRDLATVVGNLSLNGDANTVANGNDRIQFAAGAHLTSEGSITLKAATGNMTGAGALTLKAKNGISVLNSLTTAGLTTLDADTDNTGVGGDLTVAAGATINAAGNTLDISANDVDLQGNLQGGAIHIHDSDGTGIGLGATPVAGGLNIDGNELQRITTSTLELDTAGSIKVNGISGPQSMNADAVTLDAGGSIVFDTSPSTFDSLIALADNGINVNQDLTTVVDGLSLDGNNNIQFANGVKLTSEGSITLKTATGNMTGAGALTLNAKNGISVLNSLTTAGLTTLDADTDNTGVGGNVIVAAGATINAAGNTLDITANDVDLQGNLQGSAIHIHDSDGTGIGLGATPVAGGLNIDGSELQHITTSALEMDTAGSIKVNGISGAQSMNADAVTLDAGGSVAFGTNPSTFDSLTVLADNGITVNQDLTTVVGDLSLDGDADNAADGGDSIQFAPGVDVAAAGMLTLKATTGDLKGTGDLTLSANNGIIILDNLTTAGNLVANGDTTVANGVTLRSGANLSISDGNWIRGAGSLNIYANGHITLGGDATSASAMNLCADYDGSGVGQLWIKGAVSTDGPVPTGTITLVGDIRVNGSMRVGFPALSLSGADRDNVDYSVMAPIRAGGIIIRMGHSIADGTAGEASLLLAGNVNLTARTGSIGGTGTHDLDIAAGTLKAVAGGNIYIEEADSVRVSGAVKGGGAVTLNVHGSLTGDSINAGNQLTVTAGGDINCTSLTSGGLMVLEGSSLSFDALTAHSVDADVAGGIAMGKATLADLADFNAGGTISDNDSMVTAHDIYMLAGGNIGGSAIGLNVNRISLIRAGGLVHVIQHAAGNTPLGLISAGDHFEVEVPNGGFSDGNGSGLNFKAGNDSYLALHGTCGGLCAPLQIDINPGHLHVNGINISGADTPDGWVWISLEGRLGRDPATSRKIEYTGNVEIPGLVLFNNAAVIGDETVAGNILRTEAFSIETPELKSRQGVFGSPYFLHTYMNISEPIALGLVDYLLHGQACVYADPEFPSLAKRKITMWQKGYSW